MKKIILSLILLVALFLSATAATVAWLVEGYVVNPSASGSIVGGYFAGGDGKSAETAYQISAPIHIYNLAWLQYIGYFNQGDINNGLTQSYFKLTDNIDMDGLAIPPIGTTEYPFVGNFDGNNKIISNVNVGNALDMLKNKSPSNAKFDVNNLLSEISGTGAEAGSVIGFFGVIGQYEDKELHIGVDTSIIEVKNFGINNYVLENDSSATTIGFVAGYVNAKLENVLVNNCKLTVNDGVDNIVKTDGNTDISDFALVGYCTPDYMSSTETVKEYDPNEEVETNVNNVDSVTPNWGGSISMDDLYNSLTNSFDNGEEKQLTYRKTSIDESEEEDFSHEFVTHKPNAYFSAVYSTKQRADSPYLSLAGGLMNTVIEYDTTQSDSMSGRYIAYNNNYLTVTGSSNNVYTVTNATSDENATVWLFDDDHIYTYINNKAVYLNQSNQELSVDTLPTSSWTATNSKISGDGFYNLSYQNNGWFAGVMTAKNLGTFTGSGNVEKYKEIINETMDYSQNATYIPLQMNADYTPVNADGNYNTGYITSGLYDALKNQGVLADTNDDGDIRVGQYYTKNIEDKSYVYTIDKSTGQFIKIPTDVSATTHNYEYLVNLRKYEDSVKQYNGYFDNNKTELFGLHFMSGNIKNDRITVPKAQVNGVEYQNYELPADCIDFSVSATGFINFFAGTYFPQNDCFFSLNHIIRGSDNKITAVKEIVKIYDPKGNMSGGYIYKYSDGTYAKYDNGNYVSTSAPDESQLTFDMAWIMNPGSVTGWTPNTDSPNTSAGNLRGYGYYFEIPIDAGEYALGSVEGGVGAYLLYLDIGASAQDSGPKEINRTIMYDLETVQICEYANGVSLMNGETYAAIPEDEFVAFKLTAGFGTSLELIRQGNTLTVNAEGSGSIFKNLPSTFSTNGIASLQAHLVVTKSVTFSDIDASTLITTVTVATFIDSNGNGIAEDGEVEVKDGNDAEITSTTADGKTTFRLPHRTENDVIDWNSNSFPTAG